MYLDTRREPEPEAKYLLFSTVRYLDFMCPRTSKDLKRRKPDNHNRQQAMNVLLYALS
jgi:hypothetical protein